MAILQAVGTTKYRPSLGLAAISRNKETVIKHRLCPQLPGALASIRPLSGGPRAYKCLTATPPIDLSLTATWPFC